MKKLHLFLIFIFAFGIDRFTKSHLELFHAVAYSNPGFILQTLSTVSAFTRIVFISSLYGFLFFLFFLVQSLLSHPLKPLRTGMTLFFAAITGNAYDRAFQGAVTDFICVTLSFAGNQQLVYFNVADVFMWVGMGLVLYSIFKDEALIWHPQSKRNKYLINLQYQSKWAFQMALIALSSSLILILFSYTYFSHSTSSDHQAELKVYLISTLLLSFVFAMITFVASVLFSHRSAGPLLAFEAYIESLTQTEKKKETIPKFTLRKNDEHQKLVKLAEKIRRKIA